MYNMQYTIYILYICAYSYRILKLSIFYEFKTRQVFPPAKIQTKLPTTPPSPPAPPNHPAPAQKPPNPNIHKPPHNRLQSFPTNPPNKTQNKPISKISPHPQHHNHKIGKNATKTEIRITYINIIEVIV